MSAPTGGLQSRKVQGRMTIHRGHLFHLTGRPTVSDSPGRWCPSRTARSRSTTTGRIVYSGPYSELPAGIGRVGGRRPPPGIPAARVHRHPRALPADLQRRLLRRRATSGVAQLVHLPVRIPVRRSGIRARAAAVDFCDRRIAAGTTAAVVFGSAFPHAQDALFAETQRRGLRIVSGRGIQTGGPGVRRGADHQRGGRDPADQARRSRTGTPPTPVTRQPLCCMSRSCRGSRCR